MKKIIIYVSVFLLSLLVKSQVQNNVEQIQGIWGHLNDEKRVFEFTNITDNYWFRNLYYKQQNGVWERSKSFPDSCIFHFINDCPDRYSNATYTIEDTNIVSSSFIKIYPDSFSLCYNINLQENTFSLQWSEKATNIFKYYRMNLKKVQAEQCRIYNTKREPTKTYLIKGDQVEIIEEEGNWIEIKYYGQRIIEGWIPKEFLN